MDSGAYMLTINQQVKEQLDLPTLDEQEAELADGSIVQLDIVGPVDLQFENRTTTVRAMVLPQASEVLLGVIPMEDLDVLIDPKMHHELILWESGLFEVPLLRNRLPFVLSFLQRTGEPALQQTNAPK